MLQKVILGILSRVNQLNLTINLHSIKRQHYIVLAALLLVAQLFSQLHAIEHHEFAGNLGHNETTCQLCILGSGLDAGNTDTHTFVTKLFQTPRQAHISCEDFTSEPLTSSQIRAPPFSSSIA